MLVFATKTRKFLSKRSSQDLTGVRVGLLLLPLIGDGGTHRVASAKKGSVRMKKEIVPASQLGDLSWVLTIVWRMKYALRHRSNNGCFTGEPAGEGIMISRK
jgi:hypothetical protein